jgi:hypothetical protein
MATATPNLANIKRWIRGILAVFGNTLGGIWTRLRQNHDPIDSIAQVILAVGGAWAVYEYIIVDRSKLFDAQQAAAKLYIDNSDLYDAINDEWKSLAATVIGRINTPLETLQDTYTIAIKPELLTRSKSLPSVLEACISAEHCDEATTISTFCLELYELGMIESAENFTYSQLEKAISAQPADKLVTPTNVLKSFSTLTNDRVWTIDRNRVNLSHFIQRCNGNAQQKRLYSYIFEASYSLQMQPEPPPDKLLATTHISDFAPNE